VGEDAVERPGDAVEIERIDEQARVPDLAPSTAAHETPELLFYGAAAPCRHLLEGPKPVEIVIGPKDLLDPRRAERAYQLLLQIGDAHEEAEPLHVRARELGAEAGALEGSTKDMLLTGIAETRDPRAIRSGPEPLEKGSDSVRASEYGDADARIREVDVATLGQRFDCGLVAHAFDDDHHALFGFVGSRPAAQSN